MSEKNNLANPGGSNSTSFESKTHDQGVLGGFHVKIRLRHLSPNVLTSGRIFGSALVEHTTMGTLSGL